MLERVFVAGTDTGVGKTWFIREIARELRRAGIRVSARKPVQSYDPSESTTDADGLAAATGEQVHEVCPAHRSYPVALAPPMAAEKLGRQPIALADLISETRFQDGALTFIEGVGGLRSPVADDADSIDLCDGLGCQVVVLVSDAALGCINRVHLSAAAVGDLPLITLLNRYDAADETARLNRDWLRDDGVDVCTEVSEVAERVLNHDPIGGERR